MAELKLQAVTNPSGRRTMHPFGKIMSPSGGVISSVTLQLPKHAAVSGSKSNFDLENSSSSHSYVCTTTFGLYGGKHKRDRKAGKEAGD